MNGTGWRRGWPTGSKYIGHWIPRECFGSETAMSNHVYKLIYLRDDTTGLGLAAGEGAAYDLLTATARSHWRLPVC